LIARDRFIRRHAAGLRRTVRCRRRACCWQACRFLKALPKDAIGDLPVTVVDVGGSDAGIFGVFWSAIGRDRRVALLPLG